ncbi:zinc-binding dehydrogenase [Quadrisphaera sp. INWT6]|nr:zinc-binding dehydrogenase [Quadrisphaera sp. INWT6]
MTYTTSGAPAEGFHLGQTPEPHAGPGQVRIRVHAAGISPLDRKTVAGERGEAEPPTPAVPGIDAAGTVDEVGEGVSDVSVGDEVFGLGSGTHAAHAVLFAWAHKAPQIDWSVAAAAPLAVETSQRALGLIEAQAGQNVFVDGGSGGVGAVAVQVALDRGLGVVASAGQDNQDYLREIGAVPVLHGEGLLERVRAVAPGGLDAVLDIAGKTPAEDLAALVSHLARVVSIANPEVAERGGIFTGPTPSAGPDEREERGLGQAMAHAADLLRRNALVIKVQTFPLERAAEAYARSTSGQVRGKVVLLP